MAMSSGGYHHHHQQQHQQQQEMHVRWRHHQAGLLATLQQMLSSEAFVDVTLCCQGRRLRAHRVLLSASSPYLQELLMAHPASDHTTIILDDVAWEDMRALLDFMYTGGVTVPEARLAGLLEAARVLRVTVLTDGALHQRLPAAKRHPPPLIKVPYGGYPYHYHYQNGYKTESKPWPEPLSNGVKVEDQPDSPHSHHHPYSPVNSLKMDTSSSGSASPEFPWARPLPSLMPIAAAARRAPPPPPAPRRAPPAILTPSPWAQNGRPQAGAPRVRSCQDVSPRPTQDSPEARFSSPPAYAQHLDSNGVHHRQSSPRSEGDSSSDPPPTMALPRERENDENRPDGRLKERRLTEFYREQLLTNALKPPEDLSQPPLVDKMQRYSEQPFNFPMSRILGASADPAVSPLHGMRTLASLLEDGPASKDRDCADSVLAPRLNVNNNNDTDDCGKQCDVLDKRVGVVHTNSKASPPHDRRSPDRQLIAGDRLQSTHPAGDPSGMVHACQHCPKTFVTRASLKVHLRTHTGEKPFQCGECGKQFSQLRNYKYHRSVHEGTREFAATCPECGKYFNDRGYLSSHMKIHRNRKEYGCEYCGKSFNQRVAYNMHVRIHTGEKPHVCQHCSKSFSRKMLLKQHLRIHTGEKPFTCVVCQKAFADRSNMTLHMRLHSGVKPYTCNVCNKSFTKKHHLKTHMNYHTGVKPYSCAKCGLRFSQSSNMRTHFKKCNSTPPPPPTTPPATPLNMTVEAKEAA